MEWKDIPEVWQECFKEAWKSFQEGSRPIGAVITDKDDAIISRGKSAAFNTLKDSVISNNELAHAEINALLKLDNRVHTIRNVYTLYSTMEPCPLCFGAFYMSGIRKLKFAAKDKWAGSTNLKDTTQYMSLKPIQIEGPFQSLEQLSIVLNVYFELTICSGKASKVTESWREDYPEAVDLAVIWSEQKTLEDKQNMDIADVFIRMQNEIKISVSS
ncbi:nucleoside deaminase [Planococcus sp. X10-3]|uniref:nucleoside deaminase n=1 Tax=Planococcus sp. X10-3 TaxID=3061240 RepID=UPI003BAF7486